MNGGVRLGVAGCGRWGANLVRNASELGVLAAVCEPNDAAFDAIRSHLDGAARYTDFSTMLRGAALDGVVIAAPAAQHATLALEAIAAGMGAFVEKPLALCVDDAIAVVEAAQERGTPLVVGHLLLYHPAIRALLDTIAQGQIGTVRHFRSRRLGWGTLRAKEDVWWSFAPHDVSVMLEVMGEEPIEASRSTSSFVRPYIGDVAYADFRFSLGRSAHIEVCWIDPQRGAQIDVFGSDGVLSLVDARNGTLSLTLLPCGDRLSERGEPELWRATPLNIPFSSDAPLKRELEAFCESLRGGPTPPSHGDEALAVVRALEMACDRTVEVLQ